MTTLASATPGANRVVKAGADGKINIGWLPPRRFVDYADAATVTVDTDTTDVAVIPILSQGVTLEVTGAPYRGQILAIYITSALTQTISHNSVFAGSDDTSLVTDTTGSDKMDRLLYEYNDQSLKWEFLSSNKGYAT